jgi:hypothetical protein
MKKCGAERRTVFITHMNTEQVTDTIMRISRINRQRMSVLLVDLGMFRILTEFKRSG